MFFMGWEVQYNENGHSYGQLVIGSFVMTTCLLLSYVLCRVFWWNIRSPRWLTPLQPRFGALWLLAFPKTKITFEREEIQDNWWDSGKYERAADGNWENCVRSQGAYFEEDWGVIVLCTMCLVSSIFFNKCLYFSYYMGGHLLDRPLLSCNISSILPQFFFFFFLLLFKYNCLHFHPILPLPTHPSLPPNLEPTFFGFVHVSFIMQRTFATFQN